MMNYGSVCSGVEAASVAWEGLGWNAEWFCEFDDFPSAVLNHRFPDVPNLHDMTEIEEREEFNDRRIDLLVGGTPCQSFSIAGIRKGLDDERGNLALKYCQILDRKKPRWFVWENVPGVLSSWAGEPEDEKIEEWEETSDLSAIFAGFRECGYMFAYRIFDSQYFGVPQRRRRIFVVGYLGDWRPAAAVLFEQESLSRNIKPRRKEGEDSTRRIAKCLTARGAGGQNLDPETANFVINGNIIDRTENSGGNGVGVTEDGTVPTLRTTDRHAICYEDSRRDGLRSHGTISPTLQAQMGTGGNNIPLCFEPRYYTRGQGGAKGDDVCGALSASFYGSSDKAPHLLNNKIIRRFTPLECERLQGFPDNWTKIPYKGKPPSKCPDGPRYKSMGNSMTVQVMRCDRDWETF
jgi:DNA (cytosine-5)-methyltransferase 1